MRFETSFAGRIIQITEALSHDDAVSNQILAIDVELRAMGFRSEIASKWHDPRLASARISVESLQVDERDVVIYHFHGYAGETMPLVAELYCTRVLVYHNITPHHFFSPDSKLHAFCRLGRQQLNQYLGQFHRFWGDSQYNVDELIALGAPREHSAVIPIIVGGRTAPPAATALPRRAGSWLFVGRVASNKNQVELVRLFASLRSKAPHCAQELFLAGGFDPEEPYYQQLKAAIDGSGCAERIHVGGKVANEERDRLYREASVLVSASLHEGFGVPLIEAARHGMPVLALAAAAVPETMGVEAALAANMDDLAALIVRTCEDSAFRDSLVALQQANAERFEPAMVSQRLQQALATVLPRRGAFQTVSIVVCTLNRRDYLSRVLEYLSYQRWPGVEVIVVDGPSDDGTKEMIAKYEGLIKVAHNSQRNLSVSRNIGIELASGDIVAFIDDDALPFDDWAWYIVEEYNARPLTTGALGGPVYYAGSLDFQAQDIAINRFADTVVNVERQRIGKDGWFRLNIGTNATFSAAHLRRVHGFDEQFDYFLDESELCFRLQQQGCLVGYSENVLLRHEFARSDNRKGKFSYNWQSICKNTAYFIAAYSGLQGEALTGHIHTVTERDRVKPLQDAVANGELAQAEADKLVDAVWAGVNQGLDDAKHFPRTRPLSEAGGHFRTFATRPGLTPRERGGSLHICIITKEFPPFVPGGGIGTLYYQLASELLLMGHRVSVIAPAGVEARYLRGRFQVLHTPVLPLASDAVESGFAHNMSWSVSAMAAMARLDAEASIDVIESALWDSEALAVSMLPRHQRPPLVVRLVTPFAIAARINNWSVEPPVAALFNTAEARLIANADAVVPISRAIASSICSIHGLAQDPRWHLIPCGIAHWPFFDVNLGYESFSKNDRIPAVALRAEKLVLFVGRLERRKGIDLLLAAAKDFLAVDPAAQLLVCGRDVEGWEARSASLLTEDVQARVHFVGEIADSTKEKLLARAWCLVFPSRYESFGLVPLEAFVHGLPVVACRAGAIPEVVEDGKSGLLFTPDDPASLARCVSALLSDKDLHDATRIHARERSRVLGSRQSALRSVEVYRGLMRA